MWCLCPGDYLNVPTYADVQWEVRSHLCWKRNVPIETEERVRRQHEQEAVTRLSASLLRELGGYARASKLIAGSLLHFSNAAHWAWWYDRGQHMGDRTRARDTSTDEPMYFLDGIGQELIAWGWPGRRIIRCLVANRYVGEDATDRLAYDIWQAQSCPHGRDRHHWRMAQWLLAITQRTKEISSQRLTYSAEDACYYLHALGPQIFYDPSETARVFEPNFH